MTPSKPVVTIITATHNLIANKRSDLFARMMQSLQQQTYGREYIQHIVVDGGSTDGTVELLQRQHIDQWISEPDNGMYQAMNKGIELAKGEFINFLNSDDFLYPRAVDVSIEALQATNADYSYGAFTIHYPGNRILHETVKPLAYVLINTPFFFETMLIRTQCLRELGNLDETFRIAGDYDLMFRLYHHQKRGVPLFDTITGFRPQGASMQQYHQTVAEAARIRERYYFSQVPKGIINDPAMLCEPSTIQTLITSLPDGDRFVPLISFFSGQGNPTHRIFYFLMKIYRKLRRVLHRTPGT